MMASVDRTQTLREEPREPTMTLRLRMSPAAAAAAAARDVLDEQQPAAAPPSATPMPARRVTAATPQSLMQRLNRLLTRMQASQAFSLEQHAAIAKWIREFSGGWSQDLQGRDEEVSLALCWLLCRVIQPAIDTVKEDDPKELELLKFEQGLRNLLATTVSERETVEAFIGDYQEFIRQKDLMDAKLDIILSVFQDAMNRLYSTAQQLNNDLVGRVQRLEERLTQANTERKQAVRQVHASLEDLASRVQALFSEYDELVKALQIQEERTQRLNASFLSILEECKNSLGKLKR